MFEELFTDCRTIKRYRKAPLFDERLSYLEHCAEGGVQRYKLRVIARFQVHLVRLLDLQADDSVDINRIDAAAEHWLLPGGRLSHWPAGPDAKQAFIGYAVRWLRFTGMFEESCQPRHVHSNEVAIFATWMRTERGWSETTIRTSCNAVDLFFDRLDESGVALESVRIDDIDRQVAYWHACGLSRMTISGYARRVRSFFRFAEHKGWCTVGLADGILPARFQPDETVPKGLNRDEALRLLATTEGDRPADLRARAILMLLITYGLRVGEVAGLRIDDLDWREESLRVRCPKPGRAHQYPLSRSAGKTILRYIREVRPQGRERALFLTLYAPIRPIRSGAVTDDVRRRADRIGIVGKRRGPHALRHGAAQHLLNQGLSMKEVGDYLGHRSVSATATYAKVQLDTLREVGQIDLEDLL